MLNADYCEIPVGGPHAKRRGIALVDAVDAETVGAYSWHMDSDGCAVRNTPRGEGKRLAVFMHRSLLGLVPGDPDVDHINGDKLDNRRGNLRIATNAQNQQNLHGRPYRGASWHAQRNRWRACVKLDGKQHYLGSFATQGEAAAVAAAFRRSHMPFSADARADRERG